MRMFVFCCSAPAQPKLTRHSTTSKTDFVVEVDIAEGLISKLLVKSNRPLTSDPVSEEGTFTPVINFESTDYVFFPSDASIVAPTVFMTFADLPDDGTHHIIQIYTVYDGTISANETAKVSEIGYKYKKPARLMGLAVHNAAIVLAVICIVVILLVAAAIFLLVLFLLKYKAASAVGTAAGAQSATATGNGGGEGRGNLWKDPGDGVEWTINKTYDLRTAEIFKAKLGAK
ncbi:uncharacterized protein LOC134854892 [Symsagittifera roscoffensis]|uniref:uncharacterized protein LOC134854892 n=1 Tax=Symsagittifera roscoffensis TaxID=84072 RepID=UPI00307CBF0D